MIMMSSGIACKDMEEVVIIQHTDWPSFLPSSLRVSVQYDLDGLLWWRPSVSLNLLTVYNQAQISHDIIFSIS